MGLQKHIHGGLARGTEVCCQRVREIADGNETVPTVVIGKAKMVNPSPNEVLQALGNQAPELIPEGVEVPENGAFAKKLNKWLGG